MRNKVTFFCKKINNYSTLFGTYIKINASFLERNYWAIIVPYSAQILKVNAPFWTATKIIGRHGHISP
jgi:hypothetical protein